MADDEQLQAPKKVGPKVVGLLDRIAVSLWGEPERDDKNEVQQVERALSVTRGFSILELFGVVAYGLFLINFNPQVQVLAADESFLSDGRFVTLPAVPGSLLG